MASIGLKPRTNFDHYNPAPEILGDYHHPQHPVNGAVAEPKPLRIYLIGSLRNKNVPKIAEALRDYGHEVFDDWYAVGPEADDYWRKYEQYRGKSYKEALGSWAAKHVFAFDKSHIDRCDVGVLLAPAGKSAHLELGYMLGGKKRGYVLFDEEPERWDVMYQFATGIFFDFKELTRELDR